MVTSCRKKRTRSRRTLEPLAGEQRVQHRQYSTPSLGELYARFVRLITFHNHCRLNKLRTPRGAPTPTAAMISQSLTDAERALERAVGLRILHVMPLRQNRRHEHPLTGNCPVLLHETTNPYRNAGAVVRTTTQTFGGTERVPIATWSVLKSLQCPAGGTWL